MLIQHCASALAECPLPYCQKWGLTFDSLASFKNRARRLLGTTIYEFRPSGKTLHCGTIGRFLKAIRHSQPLRAYFVLRQASAHSRTAERGHPRFTLSSAMSNSLCCPHHLFLLYIFGHYCSAASNVKTGARSQPQPLWATRDRAW